MGPTESLFLAFNLPNATTWFYFSFLLSISLFFKFGRVLSMRNWDVVTIFLLVPGLMVVQAARPNPAVAAPHQPAVLLAGLVGHGAGGVAPTAPNLLAPLTAFAQTRDPALLPVRWLWLGYLWLMVGSVYLFCRCLFDLALVQRPALAPNLTFGGLAFLAIALLSSLTAVAFRPTPRESFAAPSLPGVQGPSQTVGRETVAAAALRESIEPLPWWIARCSAVMCHLAVVLGLVLIGRKHFQDATAGMAAATFYLMLPYTGFYISQIHHIVPIALVIWALVVYPWPILSGFLLGLSAGSFFFPGLLLPIWTGFYWRRGAFRFMAAFLVAAVLVLAGQGIWLWANGVLDDTLLGVQSNPAWQPWKVPHTEGFWTGDHAAYRIPVFVAYAVFVLATAVWPWPKNLAHLIALSTAVIVGIQFWYADQGGVYVLWYLPLLVLLVFRPNLADRRPPAIHADTDWLCRLRRALVGFVLRSGPSREAVSANPPA